ncbi:MAG: RNA-binding S4 domain-containing protein [Chitinophagales bacterium]
MENTSSKIRLDKYLWAIRIFKTRTQAAAAIDSGKVKCNGQALKASRTVSIGDRYDIKAENKKWDIEVIGIIEKRVAFAEASQNYIDHSPLPDKNMAPTAFYFPTGKRNSKSGRPTKKDRRNLDNWL